MQIIRPSSSGIPQSTKYFGHSLSNSVDIDKNGFADLAIGAPNSDTVFIYKSYPVIEIKSSITSGISQISTTTGSTNLTACVYYASGKPLAFPVTIEFILNVDLQLRRAQLESGKHTQNFTVDLTQSEKCQTFPIIFKKMFVDIYKPIQLELRHRIPDNKVIDNLETNDFCEDCIALDPSHNSFVTNEIPITTGCKEQRCLSNLNITSSSDVEL